MTVSEKDDTPIAALTDVVDPYAVVRPYSNPRTVDEALPSSVIDALSVADDVDIEVAD